MSSKQKKLPELKPLFLERMKFLLPDEKDFNNYLEILKQEPVRSIRCNTLKISSEELKKRLEQNYNWKISQPWKSNPEIIIIEGKGVNDKNGVNYNEDNVDELVIKDLDVINNINKSRAKRGKLIDLEPGELGRALEHLLGYYYIQELASMLPIIALNPKPGEIILDLCASPGSKTTQAAALMNNSGLIIANEISLGRIKILSSNLERCGVTNTILTRKEGVAACERLNKFFPELKFDKILVDAPCSGEGTLRSSLKTYLMWNINTVRQLSGIQKRLISSAIELLKVGGEVVYSTCTHSPEENEEVVDFVLKNFGDKIKIEKISNLIPVKSRQGITHWQDKEYNAEVKLSCRIYPQDNNTEGFFLAKFRRIK